MSNSSGRILVVDDEPQIRRVMRTTRVAQGYYVSDARTGEEALDRLRQEQFDLVLLDLNMPGMGGMEACRALRTACDVAIVVLSVRGSEKDKVEALDAGADDYVTKPFSTPELLARIRAALRRAPYSGDAAHKLIVLEGLEINLETHRVTSGGGEIRLTPKECDLLQYLVSHPNVPIPHGKLEEELESSEKGRILESIRKEVHKSV